MKTTGEKLHGVSGIYCAIHRDSGMCYVGSSTNIGMRIKKHLWDAAGGSLNAFHKAIRVFPDGFDFEVLKRCEKWELLEWEKFYIAFLDSASVNGFNTYSNPASPYRTTVSEASRQRMSAIRKGRKNSEETKAKVGAAHKGRKHSEESKANMSAAHVGKKLSEETKAKMSASRTGRKFSEETKTKISAAHKGRKASDETKARMSAARKGGKLSAEHKAKLSVAGKGRNFSEEHRANLSAAIFAHYNRRRTQA